MLFSFLLNKDSKQLRFFVFTLYHINVFINNSNELLGRSKDSDVTYHNVVKSVKFL